MKKLYMLALAFGLAMFTGCTPNETVLLAAANTAGNLGLSAWFAIDDPDTAVKSTLKDVVTLVGNSAGAVAEGGSYVEALTPAIQEFVAKREGLTGAQKNLINTGASVVLGTLDTFIDSNQELKGNAALVTKVVASFCKGCLTAIERSEDCCSYKALKKAHLNTKMRYDARAKAFTVK